MPECNNIEDDHFNSSYFIGPDPRDAWVNRTFFTYFSEFNRGSCITSFVEASVLVILCFISTVTNASMIILLTRKDCLRTVTNIFICNLAISDMLFTLNCPLIAACRITQSWTLGECACDINIYMTFVCGSVSIWTMMMISVERYFCIVRESRSTITPRMAVIAVLMMWIIALACCSPIIASFQVVTLPFGSTTVKICTSVWPTWNSVRMSYVFLVITSIMDFLIPFTVLTRSYAKIFFKFWKIRKLVKRTRLNIDSTLTVQVNRQKLRDARDLRVVKILASLVIIFAIMWFPLLSAFVFILIDAAHGTMLMASHIFMACICCAFCNACVNPILYGLTNERLKALFVSCVMCKTATSEEHGEPTTCDRIQPMQDVRTLS